MRRGIFTLFAMLAMMLTASNVYGAATEIFNNGLYKITKDGNNYVMESLTTNDFWPSTNDAGWISDEAKNAFYNIRKPDNATMTVKGRFSSLGMLQNSPSHFVSVDLSEANVTNIQLGQFFKQADSVILPDSWTSETFSKDWLQGFDGLKEITFGSGFTYIPGESFQNNNKLETVHFKEGLDSIGYKAFQNCPKLKNVTFPSSLKGFGPDAFQSTGLEGELDLSNLTQLRSLDYQAFEYCRGITSVKLPASLKYFANEVFADTNIEELDMSGCPLITDFMYSRANRPTFKYYDTLKTLILPPNLTYLCESACLTDCKKLETVVFGKCKVIGKQAFQNVTTLKSVTFPSDLETIEEAAFQRCSSLESVDLSQSCKEIGKAAFDGCSANTSLAPLPANLLVVRENAFYGNNFPIADMGNCHDLYLIEGHAYGQIGGAQGTGTGLKEVIICSHPKTIKIKAFNLCKNIERVEIKYCSTTDITECVCEYNGFDPDVTFYQTQIENVEKAARLVFSYDEKQNPDAQIKNENKTVYSSAFDFLVGDHKAGVVLSQATLNNVWKNTAEHGRSGQQEETKNHGWWEFVNNGDPITIVTPGQFIRTYSRTEGAGAVLLPIGETKQVNGKQVIVGGVHAYRAVDYVSTTDTEGNPTVDNGFIRLRELKVEMNETNAQGQSVKVEYSYVPEETGVVLYSPNISEEKGILILKPYENEDELTKYPNTGERFEEDPADDDDINMLEGSYGDKKKVAPVFPWNWKGRCYYPDGSSKQRKYRNFGLQIGETNPVQTSRWRRFTPSTDDDATKLRENRAYAQLPVARFFSDNETWQNGNLLNIEDSGQSNNMGIGFVFEDEVTGIKTVSSNNSDMMEDNTWYTIQGVKVANPTKGVYIYNHKKVVIK